jgi:hypothetical protein
MALGGISSPIPVRIKFNTVPMPSIETGPTFETRCAAIFQSFFQKVSSSHLVTVTNASYNKGPPNASHDHKQERTDNRKPKYSSKDNLTSANRLSRHRLNSLRLDVGR